MGAQGLLRNYAPDSDNEKERIRGSSRSNRPLPRWSLIRRVAGTCRVRQCLPTSTLLHTKVSPLLHMNVSRLIDCGVDVPSSVRSRLPRSIEQRLPGNMSFVGPTPGRALGFQMTSLWGSARRRVIQPRMQRGRLHATMLAAGRHEGQPGLVVGRGPSASSVDPAKLRRWANEGGVIFGVNEYGETALAEVTPTYLLLADPLYFQPEDDVSSPGSRHESGLAHGESGKLTIRELTRRTWAYVRSQDLTLVVPSHQFPPPGVRPRETLYFRTGSLVGLSKNVSPLRAPGYPPLSAYFAIAMALHLGISPVYLVGVENNWFKFLSRSQDGLVLTHHHSGPGQAIDMYSLFGGVAAMLETWARVMAGAHLFPKRRIINLDQQSLIDAFPIGEGPDIFV